VPLGAQGFKFRTLQNFQAFRWSARSRATWVSFCEGNGGLEFTDWAEIQRAQIEQMGLENYLANQNLIQASRFIRILHYWHMLNAEKHYYL
jgi:hypothetical protein